jgi:hypothetical protein
MLLCSCSRRQEIGYENEEQQPIKDDTDNGWCKNALPAVFANTEQSDDTKYDTNENQEKRNELDENSRASATAGSDENKDNAGAGPTALRGPMRERCGLR